MDEHFPTLVNHGPLIWRLISVGFVVLVLASIWTIRFASARHRMRKELQHIRANHRSIRGVLRGGGATSVHVEAANHPQRGVATWRADALWLETPDRKIELVGPVRVMAGTSYAAKRRALPVLSVERRAAVIQQLPWVIKSPQTSSAKRSREEPLASAVAIHLTAGDQVEVCGLIESVAGQGEALPREPAIAWTLRGDDVSLQLAAMTPIVPRVPLGLARSVFAILLAFGAATLVQRSLGERWLDSCIALDGEHEAGEAPVELANDHVCVLAASVPKHHDRGLDFLRRYLEDHPYRDVATVARLDTLTREVQSCTETVTQLYYRQRFEAAIDEARRCGEPWFEHESLVMLGRFEEAVAVRVPPRDDGQPARPTLSTLIAAGRWNDAAAMMRAEPINEEYRDHGVYRGCVAEWFAHLGGDRGATARLQALATSADAALCAAVFSEFEPDRRVHWLTRDRVPSSNAISVLGAAAGTLTYDPLDGPEMLLLRPEDAGREAASLWLPQVGTKAWQRASALRWQLVKQVLDNDTDGALATASTLSTPATELAKADRDEDYQFNSRRIDMVTPAILLYTPTIFDTGPANGEMWMYSFGRLLIRSRQSLDGVKVGGDEEDTTKYKAARTGDGRGLLAMIRKRFSSWEDIDLLAVLPHVTREREALARELPYAPLNNYIYGDHVFRNAFNAFGRRELLEAVGATEDAARWDATYRRFDRVFRDRARLVGLVLAETR